MKAIVAGSYAPPTEGHLDIIRRAAVMFDEVVVAVLSQQAKQYLFPPEVRKEMLEKATAGLKNVKVISDTCTLVEVVKRENADVIVRGLRNGEDLNFEMQMAQANRLIGNVETLFLPCRPEYSLISSTIVRDCAAHGMPIEQMVPAEIADTIYAAFGQRCDAGKREQ
ncbi:MAG: pantetheine-phosphate adenylyltransferase [Clostridia bacterium]|nr:pantetheine-phosphate adenylyltransferase [Clostridia bacterium]